MVPRYRRNGVKEVFNELVYLNGVPAWIYEYLTPGEVQGHSVYVMVDRGDRKVVLSFTGTAHSMHQQRDAVFESMKSIRLE